MQSDPITALPAAAVPTGNEPFPIVQSATTKKLTFNQLLEFLVQSQFPNGVFFVSAGGPITDGNLTFDRTVATLKTGIVKFTFAIESDGGGINMDAGTGEINANKLHAANGFTGTGPFTNFIIEDGIIVSAT